MGIRDSIREGGQPGPLIRQGPPEQAESVLRIEVRDEDDLSVVHRRTRQISALIGFDTSLQTQIGTAISLMTRAALSRAGACKLDFSLTTGTQAALSIRIEDGGPPRPDPGRGDDDELAMRSARHLIGDVQIVRSASGDTTALLRWIVPAKSLPLASERVEQIRKELSARVPKALVQELREQNRELRNMQKELVLSELLLRQRVRQSALMTEVADVLIGTEPIAAKLQRCVREIVEQLDVEWAVIWTADPAGEGMELAASAGPSSGDRPEQGEPGNSRLGLIARERKPYITNSVLDDPHTADREWAARYEMQAFAGCPLVLEDRALGVLAVYAREPLASDAFDTLRLVASQIAVGMERQQRIEEREHLLASEREARLKAERATGTRDRLLAVVSHDLRNPLSSIVTAAALLTRAQALSEEPRLRRNLETIIHSADRMKRLIADLLDLVSIEAGRLAFELAPESVAPLVSEVLQLQAPIADARSIRLEAKADDSLPEIRCDRGRILQVLSNLIGNAIQFTPEGGAISLRAFRAGSEVIFAVTDTGSGMSEEEQGHIFESYWQAKPGAGHGLGLGLSIAKGLVQSHGGRIWVESRVGYGSTFFVSLPVLAELAQIGRASWRESGLRRG